MKKNIKKIIVKMNLVNLLSIFFYIFRIFKIKNNKITFVNFTGKGYGDSPKYILEKLHKENKDLDFVWLVKNLNDNSIPDYVRKVKIFSIKSFYELATSKVWVNNSRFDQFVRKRKNQFYIQTWHSPLRLKKIEMDAFDNMSDYYKKVIKNDSEMIDLMISGCDFSYNIYKHSFMYNGEIARIGTPRCDLFFDREIVNIKRKKICDFYKIEENKKIILYAPTFRTKREVKEYLMDYKKVITNLDDNYVILVRLHPRMNFEMEESKKIINATRYPDMQELICATDFMITDYSSCCFDMLIADKPCFLFIKDIKDYIKEERNLYFDIEKLPFYKTQKEEELILFFKNFDNSKYNIEINKFKKRINLYENGQAGDKLVNIIEGICKNEKV